jgi:hypothetical protein
MEMVAHDAESNDLNAAEPFILTHKAGKGFLFLRAKNECAVHHAGNTVIIANG